jgi:ribose transport system ATP-binding protein
VTHHVADEVPALELRRVAKTFPATRALKGVDLVLRRGEVHALLGENGSGKSTLIKILSGLHEPDAGASGTVAGEPFKLGSSTAAHEAGLRFIHQDLALVLDLDVTDNLALGQRYVGRRWLSLSAERSAAQRLLAAYGVDVDVRCRVSELSPAERTMVAVARAMRDRPDRGVLVLDEPTASLPADEVQALMDQIRLVTAAGGSVLYVTHRLQEVFDVADSVTVLRDGELVASRPVAGFDEEQLIALMVGRELRAAESIQPPVPHDDDTFVALNVSGLTVDSVSFAARAGEILGVAGITGSGREDLGRLLTGATPWTTGRVTVGGKEYNSLTPRKSIDAGIAYAPADRQRQSAIQSWSLRENVTLPQLPTGLRGLWLSRRAENTDVAGWLRRLEVRPPDPARLMSQLSGGNQQRVVLARWLRCRPRVLVLENPTQGVDVGAKADLYDVIRDAATQGATFILISADYEELAAVCGRVLVMSQGRITAELVGPDVDENSITQAAIRPPEIAA